jgi:transcriptional regulator with PAS, ATPase and Fis domain
VLIHGPSGTGKEIIAQAIHARSSLGSRSMVSINCAAVPRHLEESEFFGHTRGAFTGAHADKQGILSCAHQTSLLLDEIGELSLETQAKLLRFLDCGQYLPVGRTTPRTSDTRIISVTNRDLADMVDRGSFRADLYYRIRGAQVCTEPLSRHREDIPVLVRHFLDQLSREGPHKEITGEALEILCDRNWPGNVRELRQTVSLLAAGAAGRRRINADDVRAMVVGSRQSEFDTGRPPYHEARRHVLQSFERDYFDDLLKRHLGNISRSAASCGIARPHLQRKLKTLGIDPHQYRC